MNKTPRLSKSGIEYLDYAWNFESGCTKGCTYCYARKTAARFPDHYPNGFEPTLYPEAFTSPLHLKKPSVIGVAFMGDLFDDEVDPDYEHVLPGPSWSPMLRHSLRDWIFGTIKKCPQHRFLFLTKRPENLAKWSPFPDNCWVGVSVTQCLDGAHYLGDIAARVKYISFEPLLYWSVDPTEAARLFTDWGINWVIIGAQTKPTILPEAQWVQDIIGAADKRGLPVFLKDSIATFSYLAANGLKWRQEMPE